ncbi:matrixin family metalloprotease [Kitasatospora sp. NBC_00458]|uniref:matrixin family metalloprotease n=1 Tax=Kitasatospora sp. NBC_00458 TaxID=2903568 RepID=UPI002E176AAB
MMNFRQTALRLGHSESPLSLREVCRSQGVSSLRGLAEKAGFETVFGTCGVPDRISSPIDVRTFGSPNGRWPKRVLTVSVDPTGANLAPATVVATVTAAFGAWQSALAGFFTFRPVSTGGDVRGAFVTPLADARFGAPGGTLATGAGPPVGTLNLDLAETWTATSLLNTTVHEIGHLLGLAHSNSPASVMYPTIRSTAVVDAESINAILSLYGWSGQESLGDRATSDRPALAVTRGVGLDATTDILHMVWKGSRDDSNLYESELGPGGWSPQSGITGDFGSSHSPALAAVPRGDGLSTGILMA